MKKMYVLLTVLLVLGLCACGAGDKPNPEQAIIRAAEEHDTLPAGEEPTAAEQAQKTGFSSFQVAGQTLTVGTAFDLTLLPQAASVYEVPSCAIEGTDTVYNYNDFELTVYDDGSRRILYSIFFLTPDAATPEGLVLGDSPERVLELYGDNYTQQGTAYIYECDGVTLSIIIQNDIVISIEYTMAAMQQD